MGAEHGWEHETSGPAFQAMFPGDAPWLFWTPEFIRRISGAPNFAVPPLPTSGEAPLWLRVNCWGSLLPLLHFHLGWERIDAGLARWSASDFDPMGDPTLTVIRDYWGPALGAATLWAMGSGGLDTNDLPRPPRPNWPMHAGPFGLHLENHSLLGAPHHSAFVGGVDRAEGTAIPYEVDARDAGPGRRHLVTPTYIGWYQALTAVGGRLVPLPNGRSWRIGVTIVPIGFVGTFRRSRLTGRWFTGRHAAHQLGISPDRQT